jgi:hypothetical protein
MNRFRGKKSPSRPGTKKGSILTHILFPMTIPRLSIFVSTATERPRGRTCLSTAFRSFSVTIPMVGPTEDLPRTRILPPGA